MKRTAVAALACLTLALATYLVYRAGHSLPVPQTGARGFWQPHAFVGPHVRRVRPVQLRPGSSGIVRTYVVHRGDCLWTIARRHHADWRHIARVNHVRTPYLIHPGQVLTWR